MSDEIKIVRRFSGDIDGEWIINCGHCKRPVGVGDGDDGTPRGEQYKCFCGGWNEVHNAAQFVREL